MESTSESLRKTVSRTIQKRTQVGDSMNSQDLLSAARQAADEEAKRKRLIDQLPELEKQAKLDNAKSLASEQANIIRSKISAALVSWQKSKQERDEQLKGLLIIFKDTLSLCRQYDLRASDLLQMYRDLAYWEVETEQGPLTDSYSHFERQISVQSRQGDLINADGVNAFEFRPGYRSEEIDSILNLLMEYVRLELPTVRNEPRFNIKSHQAGKEEQQAAMSAASELSQNRPKKATFRNGRIFED